MFKKDYCRFSFIKSKFLKISCFLLALLIISFNSKANTYYLSNSGNDSYTSSQAQNPATPWSSISQLNTFLDNLQNGDIVLFNRGDVFYGTLKPIVDGVTFNAYGSGANPVITGLTTISSWSSTGSNIWEAIVPGGLSTLNMVVINGVLTPMGRYPNADAPNGGYLTYESAVGNSSLTDGQLQNYPDWTGGEVVFRRTDYTSDRAPIIDHSGGTLTFKTYQGDELNAGYGYFVQNKLATLDKNGEWFYDPSTKKIKIFFTTRPPSIQVSTLSTLVDMSNPNNNPIQNINFSNISFRGCEENLMNIVYGNNITVSNCNFSFAGINAVEFRYAKNLTIQNSTITDINMIGIQENTSDLNYNITIKNNIIRRIGIYAGMISNKYGAGSSSIGINVSSPKLLVEQNTLDSIGYIGISIVTRSDQEIRRNVITNFCFVKNDGGAIYSRRGNDIIYSNIVIENNIISKSIGAMAGSTHPLNQHVRAIYLDTRSYGVSVLNNTIFDVWDGIYISHGQKNIVRGNTIYNVGNYNPKLNTYSAAIVLNDAFDGYQHLRDNEITNNIFFAKYPNQLLYFQTDRYNGVNLVGKIDNNYYANPGSDMPLLMTNTTASSKLTTFSINQWKDAYSNYDAGSKGAPRKIPQFIVNSLNGNNKFSNGNFSNNVSGIDASGTDFSWDNTSQVTGVGSAQLNSNTTGTNFSSLRAIIGSIDANKDYILRFKTRGVKAGSFQTYLQQWTGSYSIITSTHIGSTNNGVEQHEILFSGEHSTESNVALYLLFSQNSSTIYIDDVQFYEATVTPTNVDNYLRFDYNKTSSAINIPLGNNYIGVDGTLYNKGSITLQPFTSKILMKDTGNVKSPIDAQGKGPIATALTDSVNCSASFTNVTVSATGGTAPYKGTGNFNINAGNGSLKLVFPVIDQNNVATIYSSIGSINPDKNYILRFTTLGTTNNGHVNVYLRNNVAPYTRLSGAKDANFGTTRKDHQFSFDASASAADGAFIIEIDQNSGTTYLDNIALFEAGDNGELISNNLFNSGQFENDIDGINIWSSNNNVRASWDNSSKIYNTTYYTVTDANGKASSVGVTSSQGTTPLAAASKAGVFSSGGDSVLVIVSAIGGAQPYKGTGTFTVNAGRNSFTVTDANGCSDITEINISQAPSLSGPTVVATSAPVNCNNTFTQVTVRASSGTAPYTGTGVFNSNAGTGSLKVSFQSYNPEMYSIIYAPIGKITAGKRYALNFSTLGTTETGSLNLMIRNFSTPFQNLSKIQSANYGTTQIDHQFFFTALQSDDNGSFHIEIAQSSGTTYIDNIAFFESNEKGDLISENLYKYGQFENSLDNLNGWSENYNEITAWDNTAKINNIDYYTVTDASGAKSTVGITINQPAVSLNANADAGSKNNVGKTVIKVTANGGAEPYSGTGTFAVDPGTYNYTVQDANGCSSTASITVLASNNRIESVNTLNNNFDLSNASKELKISSYPNPTTTEFKLLVEGGTYERVNINVMSVDGRMVYQTTGSSNQIYKFGDTYLPGVYIIKVMQGNSMQMMKVVKAQ